MYVMRRGRGENIDKLMNSKPCPQCERFLQKCMDKYGLRNVYYFKIFKNIDIVIYMQSKTLAKFF